jgi:hypothetical protein
MAFHRWIRNGNGLKFFTLQSAGLKTIVCSGAMEFCWLILGKTRREAFWLCKTDAALGQGGCMLGASCHMPWH